ncbi:MAG TPA: rhodanese-like domain-containing protein [Gemmatimonadaceae bacterium]
MLLHRSILAGLALVLVNAAAAAQSTSSLLITPLELAGQLRDPNLVVLHVGPRDNYDAGHIEGARYVSLRDLSAADQPGAPPLELPDEADLRQRLERLGIGDNSRVVITFGQDWLTPATRVVWVLQTAGLAERTRLLDGGTVAWQRDGRPLTTTVPAEPRAGRLTLAFDRSIVVDRTWVQARSRGPGIRLIDGRAPMFYEGPGPNGSGAGHIPGAKNIPFNTVANDSVRFLSVTQLRRLFDAAGVQPGDTVAAYCHIGQQATAVLFAARLLGHPVRLYDGSMRDWEARGLPLDNPSGARPPADRSPR